MGVEIALEGVELSDQAVERLKNFAERLLKAAGLDGAELSVLLVNDERIRELNRNWRNKDKPTDVLSFPQDFPDREFPERFEPEGLIGEVRENCRGCRILGDIVVSVDTARRQAGELGWSLEEELERLLLHGFVHLLGFDHERDEKQRENFERLEEFLKKRAEEV